MSDPGDRRLVGLEERVAFQERALEQLNRVVAEQQLELDDLTREVKELRALQAPQGDDAGESHRTLEDDRPPHY